MSKTVTQLKQHLSAQLHGGTLSKVRNFDSLLERAINNMLSHIKPVSSQRTTALVNTVHDNEYNYSLPTDYDDIIDLIPQDTRYLLDAARRVSPRNFDLRKMFLTKQLSVEGQDGTKFLRIAWKNRNPKTLNSMNSLTGNGTFSAVGTAANLKTDTIFKVAGSGSIEFDIVTNGDGIKNTTMSSVDLTTESQLGDLYAFVYLPSITNLTSISMVWGNDLNTKYWTGVAQTTQADGTAFRVGWNLVKTPWSTAIQTGTVAPATINSFQITFATTGAIAQVRVDNIVVSIGRPFDLKYYSKYLMKGSDGVWKALTTSDDDVVLVDQDELNILVYEILMEGAQQLEGTDSAFDITYAEKKLFGDTKSNISEARVGLYQKYAAKYPTQAKKATTSYYNPPKFNRGVIRYRR